MNVSDIAASYQAIKFVTSKEVNLVASPSQRSKQHKRTRIESNPGNAHTHNLCSSRF